MMVVRRSGGSSTASGFHEQCDSRETGDTSAFSCPFECHERPVGRYPGRLHGGTSGRNVLPEPFVATGILEVGSLLSPKSKLFHDEAARQRLDMGIRGFIHFALFLISFYFGFINGFIKN